MLIFRAEEPAELGPSAEELIATVLLNRRPAQIKNAAL